MIRINTIDQEIADLEVAIAAKAGSIAPKNLPLAYEILTRLNMVSMSTDAELRLIGGELTAQEIRAVRASVRYILNGNSK